MKLLLTAFDPFAGDTINPALEAVKLVPNKIGRFEITLERVAINIDDARIKDSEGNQRSKPPCGSIKYIRTFVCNHLMYGVLYTLAKKYPHIKGGFTHVPFIPAQAARRTPVAPYMALEDIRRGLEAAIVDIDKNFDADINVNGGKEF